MKKLISLLILIATFFLTVSMYVQTSDVEEIESQTVINDQVGLLEVSVEDGI